MPHVDPSSGRSGVGRCGAMLCAKSGETIYALINGVDIRGAVNWRQFEWNESTGAQPDTVKLPIREFFLTDFIVTADGDFLITDDGDLIEAQQLLNPVADSVVELAIGAPDNLVFSGHLQRSSRSNVSPTYETSGIRTDLDAVGIERFLAAELVWGTFTGSATDVVLQLVTLFTSGQITTGGVEAGAPVVGSITFKMVPFDKAMDRICQRVGFQWNMRVKDLQFFDVPTEPKAAPLNEVDWGWQGRSFRGNEDISQLRNRIFVEGAGGLTSGEPAIAGTRAVLVADATNFQDVLDEELHGYLQGEQLLETTDMLNVWTQTNVTSVVQVTGPAGIVEGDAAVEVDVPSNDGFIVEDISEISADGTHTFSFYIKAGTSPNTRVQVRDTTAAVNRIIADVTFTGGAPTINMVNGTLFREPVIAVPTAPDGWFTFIVQADDIVGANAHIFRLYGSRNAAGGGATSWWGPMAEQGAVYSFPTSVETDVLPNVGAITTRKRRLAWLGDTQIAYRWTFTGVAEFENWAPFSYELENWALGVRTNVVPDQSADSDGNNTMELIEWDGTGGAGTQHDIGVDDFLVQVILDSDGEFALQVDVRDGPVTGAGFARIGFFETGASLPAAGNLVAASFNLATGASLNVTGGAVASQVDHGGGLRTIRVTGTMAAFAQGQDVRASVYPCKSDGTIGVTPNTDGDQIFAGRVGLERGAGYNAVVPETGPTPEVTPSGQFSLVGGIPGSGPYAINGLKPSGSDLFPWITQEDQDSINERAIVVQGSWKDDGPVQFFKRDRRLNAAGMVSSGVLELVQYIGRDQNARSTGTYRSRDRSIRAGREVDIDLPGVRIAGTFLITQVITRYLKAGILERTVQFGQAVPRSVSKLLLDTKRFAIEDE